MAATLVLGAPRAEARTIESLCHTPHVAEPGGHLHAQFTTRFKARYKARAANVRLAANHLDGVIVGPHQQLSYNRIVGPRSEETGFRLAPAIDRGRQVDKWGGGACQPSSTLHGAAVLGGLQIAERRPHTWRSKYIADGFDATVVWGRKDLVVANPYPYPIRLDVQVGDGHMTVRLLGERPRRGWTELSTRTVQKHEFETVVEMDPSLREDQMLIMITGSPGGRVERRLRSFSRPGSRPTIRRLSDDIYYPRDSLVRIGPARTAQGPNR